LHHINFKKLEKMATITILLITYAIYKIANMHDKTDRQKHEEYKKELIRLYDIKKLKN